MEENSDNLMVCNIRECCFIPRLNILIKKFEID